MNIFYTNSNPKLAALDLCKVHRNKMIVEAAQMLSTAHHVLKSDIDKGIIYKKTHENHPSSKWVRRSENNYKWVLDWALELCSLYESDTGKIHKTSSILEALKDIPFMFNLSDSEPPFVGDDDLRKYEVKEAYQKLLQRKYTEWQNRDKPIKVEFFNKEI